MNQQSSLLHTLIHLAILYQLPIYYILSVMIDQLPAPGATSSGFYKWFFGVVQVLAANLNRSKLGIQGKLNGGLVPKIVAVILLSLLLPLGLKAQTNVAPPPTFHFVAGGSAIGFSTSQGSQVGSIAYTGLQLTNSVSAIYEHLSVPSTNYRTEMGVLSYTRQLSSLLGSSLSSKLLFDTSNMNVTFSGGAGKAFSATGSGIAETVGVSLSYPIPGTSAAFQIIGYQYVHGAGVGGLVTRNQQVTSSGLIVYF